MHSISFFESLFLRLTVEEHVWFYGCLKGLSEAEVKAEMDTLLEDVGLLHKRHEQTKNLSGRLARLYNDCIYFIEGVSSVKRNLLQMKTPSCFSVRWHAEEAVCGDRVCRRLEGGCSG